MKEAESAPSNVWNTFGKALSKTRNRLTTGISDLILGKPNIDESVFTVLETSLLIADVGVPTTTQLINGLARHVKRQHLRDSRKLFDALKSELLHLTTPLEAPFNLPTEHPSVVLVIGVNGAGKTTTIGKLAHRLKVQGKSVLLAAGDTYRAAAIEQITAWGKRGNIPVISQRQGADSASTVYDALSSARARKVDVVIADTAGRLQNKVGLMNELAKIKRVIQRFNASAPHEVVLVLDATVGQNALAQVAEFHESVGVTGLVVTKLDGTAKAGFILAIREQIQVPLYFVGLGEGTTDLQPFLAEPFVAGLLGS